MTKESSVEILPHEIVDLFHVLGIWGKIRLGALSTEPRVDRRSPSTGYPGGTSEIVKHRNAEGYHAITTHRVVMPDGSIPHWDAKDIRMGEVVIWSR